MDGIYYRQLYRDRIRHDYSRVLIELAKRESEITKLKKEAKELEDLLIADDNDIPPHLDKDGCVYWDSVLVKEENDDN